MVETKKKEIDKSDLEGVNGGSNFNHIFVRGDIEHSYARSILALSYFFYEYLSTYADREILYA